MMSIPSPDGARRVSRGERGRGEGFALAENLVDARRPSPGALRLPLPEGEG